MANSINDLYSKYVNRVGRTLESDRYFQYLYEMTQAGKTNLQQKNVVLHKVVDERWLTIIEESLDAINTIIEKPRRFVTTNEEVVPVELAKKITADSVRHLSMNTQFIASTEDGNIHPTRILNVSTEESFDLYENRFIYHLIQRLVTFIDKRTDVIFWSTGDETRNTLKMESKVDDAYEEIEYKIEMTVKNRQSFAENDSENMQVFMRIDRVRRMVMALRNSSFCSLMAGCAKVRSPIQRTNLMMKDPHYRTCYKLWQFLESYDEVGYTIDAKASSLEFDEEYLLQMYTNLITNYTVFKSLLESDPRKLEEAAAKRRSVIKPKFIKKVEELIVDDYDIPDVEVRKVIVEEVTQAQLDAEAKLEEEIRRREAVEQEKEAFEMALQRERWQAESQMQALRESADAQLEEVQKQAQEERERAEAELAEARRAAEAQLEEVQKQAQEERERAEAELAEARRVAEEQLEEIKKQAQEERERAEAELAEARRVAEAQLEELKKQAKETQERAEAAVKKAGELVAAEKEARKTAEREASAAQSARTRAEQSAEQDQKRREQAETQAKADRRARKRAEEQAAEAKQAKEKAERLAQSAQLAAEKAAQREKQAQERAEKEARARAKAEAKADANRLSNRILAAWSERRTGKSPAKDEHTDDQP